MRQEARRSDHAHVIDGVRLQGDVHRALEQYSREEKQPMQVVIAEILRGFFGLAE